jgi:flagellin FlaB
VRRVKISLTQRVLKFEKNAAVGIGTLIIFIAMIVVAGMATSVIIQTMNSLEQQTLTTSEETLKDISGGLKVTQVSGYNPNSLIDQIALFIETTAGSYAIDLSEAFISISDSSKQSILNYNSSVFSNSVSNGLFGTVNSSNLTATTFGIMVVRDIDYSCSSSNPVINEDDLIVLLINTTKCFSGINTRTEVFGDIIPETGIKGVISFTTPSVFIDTIIELQP